MLGCINLADIVNLNFEDQQWWVGGPAFKLMLTGPFNQKSDRCPPKEDSLTVDGKNISKGKQLYYYKWSAYDFI